MTLQLGDKAIFAAGDMEHGPSSAVYAMASGRRAATSIIRLLAGQDMFYGRQYAGPYVDDLPLIPAMPSLSLVKRAWATSARVPEISLKRRNI